MPGEEFDISEEAFFKTLGLRPKKANARKSKPEEDEGLPRQIQKQLAADLTGGSLAAGFAQYIRTELQQDVKPGMPLCFTACLGGENNIELVEQGSAIKLSAGEATGVFVAWYNVSAAPATGVTASLLLEADGKELLGSRSFCRNAYFMGTCMSLGAHAAVLVPKGEQRLIRLVNGDSTADIGNASVLVIRLG